VLFFSPKIENVGDSHGRATKQPWNLGGRDVTTFAHATHHINTTSPIPSTVTYQTSSHHPKFPLLVIFIPTVENSTTKGAHNVALKGVLCPSPHLSEGQKAQRRTCQPCLKHDITGTGKFGRKCGLWLGKGADSQCSARGKRGAKSE
jgi:hypothetical protein